jgi:hypothetical protein
VVNTLVSSILGFRSTATYQRMGTDGTIDIFPRWRLIYKLLITIARQFFPYVQLVPLRKAATMQARMRCLHSEGISGGSTGACRRHSGLRGSAGSGTPLSLVFADWLSVTPAHILASGLTLSRTFCRSRKLTFLILQASINCNLAEYNYSLNSFVWTADPDASSHRYSRGPKC